MHGLYVFHNEINFRSSPHIGLVTTLDHVPELSLVSAPCDKFVGHGLVALPPRPVGASDYSVLIGRRNLKHQTDLI